MKESDQHRVTRWIDGELTDDEVRDLLEQHPELLVEKTEALRLGEQLRQELPAEEEIPHPDFFNHQIEQEIQGDHPESMPAQLFPVFQRMKWTAFAGAIVMVVLLCGMGMGWFGGKDAAIPGDRTEIVSVYAPDPNHEATVSWSKDAEATVMTISGLEPVSGTTQIAGYFPDSSTRNPGLASTTFFAENGEPLLVLTISSLGLPSIRPINL
ncbi:MAG: hypothetical protein ACI8UO_002366 [Verrucomicrobiales bacterium]|jgi:hypothetical protein